MAQLQKTMNPQMVFILNWLFSIVGTNGWSKEYDEFNEEYEC